MQVIETMSKNSKHLLIYLFMDSFYTRPRHQSTKMAVCNEQLQTTPQYSTSQEGCFWRMILNKNIIFNQSIRLLLTNDSKQEHNTQPVKKAVFDD